ncbi:MAG: heat-shock protein [Deltaproteobacteria bacterium]|nr:MAG: heat-shock protein [Deltaproteobacteria bacterium]
MELMLRNPMNPMGRLNDTVNRLFNELFEPVAERDAGTRNWAPVVDIFEAADAFVIKADLPGIPKENIDIDVKDRVLTVCGERADETEVKEETYFRKERRVGKFMRTFSLPATVDAENITAEHADGVLTVRIPRKEEVLPKRITVS